MGEGMIRTIGSTVRTRRVVALVHAAALVTLGVPAGAALFGSSWPPDNRLLGTATIVLLSAALFSSVLAATFRLAWTIFWAWNYVFLGLAPAYQLAFLSLPWGGVFPPETVGQAQVVVLLGSASAWLAGVVAARVMRVRPTQSALRRRTPSPVGPLRTFLLAALVAQIAAGVLFAALMGSSLALGRDQFSASLVNLSERVPGGGTIYFTATAFALVVPAVAIAARRNGVRLPVTLLAAAVVVGLIVTNPLIGSRFLTGAFMLSIVIALLMGRHLIRYVPLSLVALLVTIFPALDVLRGDGTGATSLALSLPHETLLSPDFDSFELLVREVSLGGRIPAGEPTALELAVAPFMRWIPLLSRSVEGDISGPTVARSTGMGWTNVSMPLWGELHLTGGIAGVLVGGVLAGFLLVALSAPVWVSSPFRKDQRSSLAEAGAAPLILIVLRGSLYEVLGYLIVASLLGLAVRVLAARQTAAALSERPRTVAFYLPQFHAIPQNDSWWGAGFTEWTNVNRARPSFSGHDHPRIPGELGQYDLSDPGVMHEQAELARHYDVDAFCFYFYWFDGTRLLEKPLDNYLLRGPDHPFCISWANENWSRRWDGKENELLIAQDYSAETPEKVFESFLPYLRDDRYLRVKGAAVLVVHRADHLPRPRDYATVWREQALAAGIGELYLVAAETKPGIRPNVLGFDALAEFPPVGSNTLGSARLLPVPELSRTFAGRLMSYRRMARRFMGRRMPAFPVHRGVAPGWDNTARRGDKATVYTDSSPARYARWLRTARLHEQLEREAGGLVFINAWNEWAEGAYLEPDGRWGRAYLEATRFEGAAAPPAPRPRFGPPTSAWGRSLLLASAGSALALVRRGRSAVERRGDV